jgi:peroxiredoxin
MKSAFILGGLLAAGAIAGIACAQGGQSDQAAQNAKAPEFSAKASDGKTYTLKALTEKKPVFLYFVKRDCGSNPMSVKLYNRLYNAYKGKVNFYAVINTDAEGFKGFASEYRAPFVALLDANKDVIKSYGIRASQTVVMVDTEGKRTKFGGFGKESLAQLNAALAKAAGVDVQTVDLSDAPNGVAYG